MKRICVWGTSIRKVADEAQLLAVIKILKSRIPDAQITLFTKYGELVAEVLAEESLEVKTIRTRQFYRVIRALSAADIFVIVGGPFYEGRVQLTVCFGLVTIARFFRVPVMAYGATAFSFRTRWGRLLYRHIFNRMNAITVREPVTVDILKDIGVKKEIALFADPRFVLTEASSEKIRDVLISEGVQPEKPIIAITTRYLHQDVPGWVKRSHHYTEERVQNANEVLARVAAYVSELAQLVLVPMHPTYDEDLEMANVVRRYMSEPSNLHVLSRHYSSREVMGIIGRSELLLASRLGSAVFATVTGTPIVAIAYEPRMLDHMNRLALGSQVFDWMELKYDDVVAKIDEVWASRSVIQEHMRSRAKEFEEMARNNGEIVKTLLASR